MNKTYKANKNHLFLQIGTELVKEGGYYYVFNKGYDTGQLICELYVPENKPEWYDEVVECEKCYVDEQLDNMLDVAERSLHKNCIEDVSRGFTTNYTEETAESDDEVGYKILWSHDARVLSCNIVDSIQQGWKPLGGVQVIEDDGGYQEFYQSMVRNLPS